MKRILETLAAVLSVYLLGAFIAADMDFRNWSQFGRYMIGSMSFVFGALVYSYPR